MNHDAPTSHDTPPGGYVRWRFWLPGLSLALGATLVLLLVARYQANYGFFVVLGVPLAFGCAIGYGVRVKMLLAVLLGLTGAAALIGGAVTFQLAGLLCGLVLAGILFGPIVVGTLLGAALRTALKNSRFSQRRYLPVILLLLTTGALTQLEHRLHRPGGVEIVRTERVVPFDARRAWDSVVFYEEIRHAPPLMARFGLPHPLYTAGEVGGVGDVKVCVYDSGHLTKRITEHRPGVRLAFDVLEQRGIEDRSVRLLRGSFDFEPLVDGRTRITLTTEYEPLLSARLVWRPFERRLARVLHEHVLFGISQNARADGKLVARGGP